MKKRLFIIVIAVICLVFWFGIALACEEGEFAEGTIEIQEIFDYPVANAPTGSIICIDTIITMTSNLVNDVKSEIDYQFLLNQAVNPPTETSWSFSSIEEAITGKGLSQNTTVEINVNQINNSSALSTIDDIIASVNNKINITVNGVATTDFQEIIGSEVTGVTYANIIYQDQYGEVTVAGTELTEVIKNNGSVPDFTTQINRNHTLKAETTAHAPGASITAKANISGSPRVNTTYNKYKIDLATSLFGAKGNYSGGGNIKFNKTSN